MKKDAADTKRRKVAHKTADIFSGITGKRLVLKDAKTPYTDGKNIGIPFEDPMYYQHLEHEIAHVLFESDPLAHGMFIAEYTERISKIMEKSGSPISEDNLALLKHGLSRIIGITEDHRVNSLWGLLYPGSFKIIKEQDYELTAGIQPHEGVCNMYMYMEGGWSPVDGPLSRFEPYMQEALDKVECRGFEATLMVSKWLVANLVSEFIRENKGEESPKRPEPPKGAGDKSAGGQGADEGLWTPPKVDATPQERAEALQQLIEALGNLPKSASDKINDVREPETKGRGETRKAADTVSDALKLDIHNTDDVSKCLGQSAKQMSDVIDKAKKSLADGSQSVDGWLRKDIDAKVVFLDVRAKDVEEGNVDFLPEDANAVKRLRAVFNRVMGRRKYILEDQGLSIDVASYIEHKATGRSMPCYKQESRGRGFQALVLVDRSSSMHGGKKAQSERACRILARALKYPFVDLRIWGWNSQENGQITISRFDPDLEVFDSAKSRVKGTTPLHLAVQVGARYMEMGNESKYLIVTTDGQPVFTGLNGEWYSNEWLSEKTRDEVRAARTKGINVTGVIIGDAIDNRSMSNMFGKKHWSRMSEKRLGEDLVKLVATSFMDYLKRG
jgi:hypothetical protein